jgi:hypothetical protein
MNDLNYVTFFGVDHPLMASIFLGSTIIPVNVLNMYIIDLTRKYYTHLQREIEKEEEGETEWKNSH